MSTHLSYGRCSVEDLLRAMDDRKTAVALSNAVGVEWPRPRDPSNDRVLYIDQTWDAIGYLMECAGGPEDIVYGEAFVPKLSGVGYLTDDRVVHIAEWLAGFGFDDLMGSIDPENPSRELYKMNLARPGHQEWTREIYDALVLYFAAAARHGEAMLLVFE